MYYVVRLAVTVSGTHHMSGMFALTRARLTAAVLVTVWTHMLLLLLLCCVVLSSCVCCSVTVLLCTTTMHAIGSLQTCAGFTNPSESQDCLCIMPSGATLVGSTMRARHIACERSNMFACVLGSLRLIAGVSQTSAVMTLCRVCQAS